MPDRVDRWTGKPRPAAALTLDKPGDCDDCGDGRTINDCPRCGAPVCCTACCASLLNGPIGGMH